MKLWRAWGGVKLLYRWPSHAQVELETDCATVVTKVRSNIRDSLVISTIIDDIKEIMLRRRTCRIQKVWREESCVAHN
jgi:hypothetical protein